MKLFVKFLKFILSGLLFVILTLGLVGCVAYFKYLPDVGPDATGPEARPVISARTIEDWETRRPELKAQFETHIYGVMPEFSRAEKISSEKIEITADYIGRAERWTVSASMQYGDSPQRTEFDFILILPDEVHFPAPVIMMESFSDTDCALPKDAVESAPEECSGPLFGLASFVFGRYIATPPVEELMQRGYAIAYLRPSGVVPDDEGRGLRALYRLTAGYDDDGTRLGAIGAWAWTFSRMVDVLEEDDRLDATRMIAFGHSRYGKAALVAAAFDPRIDGVISHQSGTGGASLNRDKVGESIGGMTSSYAHWFAPVYSDYADVQSTMPVDQHQLIALIAPRPVLLGNARRDQWSDPAGAFRAAQGADPVYELYGKSGLDQSNMGDFNPTATLAFSMRGGTHGITEDDWPLFFEWLDVHFSDP